MEAPLPRLLARAARVAGHAAKKAERKKLERTRDERWKFKYGTTQRNKILHRIDTDAEKAWKEDWATGSRIMARRDTGANRLTFGSISNRAMYRPPIPEKLRVEPWLAPGDRVVILSGRDKGKIDTVEEVQEEEQTVRLADSNKVSQIVPEFLAEMEQYTPTTPGRILLPFNQVKLVHAMADEAGYYRDVIVDEVKLVKRPKEKKAKRVIPGLEVEVPWPKEEEPDHEDTDADTLRMTVDERTFEPALNELPFPSSVMDELRGKYSKFRTRHDPEWLAEKEAEVARLRLKAARVKDMGLTPFEKQAAEHKAKPKVLPELTEEQLAAIGETMMKETPERAAAALKRLEA